MLKRILLAALLWPLVALGQSYPSPTYQNLTVLGTLSASIALGNLPAQAANTVVANATSSSHTPTAVSIPSCSTTNSALQYTSGTGFGCLTTSAVLGANTFTANQTIGTTSPFLILNDTSGTGSSRVAFESNSALSWAVLNTSSTNTFSINWYTAGTLNGTVFSISPSTGAVTMADGVTGTPISGSTGSFTTLSASSTITPSQTAGIVGTTTNNSANAGSVGEYVTATGTSVSLTNNTTANVTSISLTAGDWDVSGSCTFQPAATTTVNSIAAGISTTSVTFPAVPLSAQIQTTLTTGANQSLAIPVQRLSLSTTTTVYLVAQTGFGASTMTATAMIRARRVR